MRVFSAGIGLFLTRRLEGRVIMALRDWYENGDKDSRRDTAYLSLCWDD